MATSKSKTSSSKSGTKKTTTAKSTAAKSTAAKSTAKKSTTGRTATKRTTSAKGRSTITHENDGMIRKEIILLVAFTCNLLLFLSNLHLCGAVGEALYGVMRGLFGILGYVFPVYLFLAAILYVMNRGDFRAYLKLIVSLAVLICLCGLVHIVSMDHFDGAMKLGDYYAAAGEGINGGLFGGMMTMLLYPSLGLVGACLIMIVLSAIGLVFITERSILQPIQDGGKKVYDTAKEDMDRRRAIRTERVEEEKRLRAEQKVSGVALNTRIEKDGQLAFAEKTEPAANKKKKTAAETSVEVLKGQIHGIDTGYRTITPKAAAQMNQTKPGQEPQIEITGMTTSVSAPEPASTKSLLNIPISKGQMLVEPKAEPQRSGAAVTSGAAPSGESLTLGKDYRTLSELESLDQLHSSFHRGEEMAAGVVSEPQIRWSAEASEGYAEQQSLPAESELSWAEMQKLQESPVASSRVGSEYLKEDTRTVVTGNGKRIEADIDPKEDPLQQKRMQNRENSIWSSGTEKSSSGGHSFTQVPAQKPEVAVGSNSALLGTATVIRGGAASAPVAGQPKPEVKPKKKLKPYERPPLKFMTAPEYGKQGMTEEDLRQTAATLQQTLRTFGVGVTVTNISCGPTVTRYELQPEMGVKVSRIVGLSDDIKLNLAASDIRIEAPIPGKAAVGIEVPNKENQTVTLREVIESPEFQKHPSKLAFALGRDIGGQCIVADLAKMPHLLIAGATGSGKSVCINTLIISILYKALPSEVELIMIDPKVVELSVYNGIPHLKIPVVTDPKKAAAALNWAVAEMNSRYKKFADYNVRDLKGYNERIKREAEEGETEEKPLPQIVIIVDELADLMMVAPGEVEDAICRLAQMARAAGLHLVLATQRPSVNVITGLIKANVPSRIAFSVTSGVDSRTIIDMVGAEKLLGKGDMLYYPSGYTKPARVQGAFLSDKDVAKIAEFLKERDRDQPGAQSDCDLESRIFSEESEGGAAGAGASSDRDSYFAEAGRFVIEKEKASIGMLQRAFKIGFNRAARIVDQLEEAGVVGPEEGTKPRKILVNMAEFEEMLRS